ncbi:TT39C-like protein, partial [Mya arenaria]
TAVSVEERIQRQVIVGDSLLYQSILVFTGQDIPSYIKGGWLLRKAWKIYEKLYKEITSLRDKSKLKKSESKSSISNSSMSSEGPIDGNDNEIPSDVLERLQGAVNFGYGTFQICVSMIPPKIIKIIEFLGFEGDRVLGLKSLEFTCNSDAMNAPLATLGLLWYHTKQMDLSLKLYNEAYKSADGQKELELMCLYEIVCLGSMGDTKGANDLFKMVPGLLKKKNNQIEAYVSRKAEKIVKILPSQEYCRLLTLELVFLWHALPTLTPEELKPFHDVCDMQTDPRTFHLKCLLEGAIFHQLGEEEMAMQCLDESLARHSGMKDELHVPPFAKFEMASIYMKKPE